MKEHITLPLSQIIPYDHNPRRNDQAVPAVLESIRQCTYINEIIVDESNTILAGHTRYKALRQLGYGEVEVCRVSGLTEEQKRKYRLLDNKTGELAEWDSELLSTEMDGLDFEGFDFGFNLSEEPAVPEIVEDDAPEPETENPPFARRGDVFLLGRHRLMCGDSTVAADVQRLLEGVQADCVFTDPPWNVNYGADVAEGNAQGYKPRTILNDAMSTEDFKAFMEAAYGQLAAAVKPGAMVYVVMSAQEWGNNMLTLAAEGFHWSSTVIWHKQQPVLSRKDYHTKYEPIWYGWKEGAPRLCPLEDRKQSDVWDIDRPRKSDEHPTMKPVALVARAILNSSRPGASVLDLFGGSGTTLVASEQTGRQAYLMELDPRYVDVIVRRYLALAGAQAQAILIRDGERVSLPGALANARA
ncbi:MAG: DNA modification methylase [Clostridiales bacterium]|nr:DNA modification methylase [Clostridiales bacterium]